MTTPPWRGQMKHWQRVTGGIFVYVHARGRCCNWQACSIPPMAIHMASQSPASGITENARYASSKSILKKNLKKKMKKK
jgi:hypothetical protein